MRDFKLTNLRELSTEEQLRINGGVSSTLCDADCGTCSCTCKCDSEDPSCSNSNSSKDLGSDSKQARKQREAMSAA